MSNGIFIAGCQATTKRLSGIISLLGLESDQAHSMEQALSMFAQGSYSMALVDAASTDFDAVQLLSSLREEDEGLVAFVATPELKTSVLAKFIRLKIKGYLLTGSSDLALRDILAGALGVEVPPDRDPEQGDLEQSELEPGDAVLSESVTNELAQKLDVPIRALIVEPRNDANLERIKLLKASLRRLGIEAHEPGHDSHDVFALLGTDMRFGMLLVSLAHLKGPERAALRKTLYESPLLTTIVSYSGDDLAELKELKKLGIAAALRDSVSPAKIAQVAHDSLPGHFYDLGIGKCLAESLPNVLGDCRMTLEQHPALVRVSSRVLGRLTATIEICGDDINGRIAVSGDPIFFERVSRAWLGAKPKRKVAVWDACGELSNRLAGEVRRHYASRGLSSTQSTPTIIEGSDVQLQYGFSRAGLVQAFGIEESNDLVYVELILNHKSDDRMEEAQEYLQTGEMELF